MEIWKEVKGYEGLYEVSNFGLIKSLDRTILFKDGRLRFFKGKFLGIRDNGNGYKNVDLSKKGKLNRIYVHRLVADNFLLNPENKTQVNHKNGDKSDNRVQNLEWCTPSENNLHSYRTGLNKGVGEKSHLSKLTEKEVISIRSNKVNNQREIAKIYGISQQHVSRIVNKSKWNHI